MKRRLFIALLVAWVPLAVAADTIYLANGRVIRTESARVEGDRVIFLQYGGEVSIPLAAVLRIVADDESERPSAPLSSGDATGAVPAAPADSSSVAARSGSGSPPDATASQPSDQADYWIKRIEEVDARIARVRAELDRLPEYDEADRRLLRYSGQARYFMAERDKWQAMLNRFESTRRQLFEGARKAGITPGALRDGLR